MVTVLIGIKQTSNGNLIGEFSNDHSDKISTESCDLTSGDNSSNYLGEYDSTWQEERKPVFANLKISKAERSSRLFHLEWRRSGALVFEGEGMLCDDILIGDYHQA
jgi:hypothetical protein